jgi:molecular chaperone DnaK (HSP70)
MKPANTVVGLRRMIGRKFTDPLLQRDAQHWPFKVVQADTDRAQVEVVWRWETKRFAPKRSPR